MGHDETRTVRAEAKDAGKRLDRHLASALSEFSRSRIQQLIAEGCVRAGGSTITDPSRKVKPGEAFELRVPPARAAAPAAVRLPLTIIYEDAHLLVIDKPAGMTVHPAPGHAEDTLVNALLAHCAGSLSGIGGVMRPGIVHRIDKDTSGLLAVAKTDSAHRHLAAQLASRMLSREYLAVVRGHPRPPSGTISAAIARSPVNRKKMAAVKSGGRAAVTHYRTEKVFANASLVSCRLETGRTHQIRVHLSHIGHPIVGDKTYGRAGKNIDFHRQALHAAKLVLIHPDTEEKMEFVSPLPGDMQMLIERLDAHPI